MLVVGHQESDVDNLSSYLSHYKLQEKETINFDLIREIFPAVIGLAAKVFPYFHYKLVDNQFR